MIWDCFFNWQCLQLDAMVWSVRHLTCMEDTRTFISLSLRQMKLVVCDGDAIQIASSLGGRQLSWDTNTRGFKFAKNMGDRMDGHINEDDFMDGLAVMTGSRVLWKRSWGKLLKMCMGDCKSRYHQKESRSQLKFGRQRRGYAYHTCICMRLCADRTRRAQPVSLIASSWGCDWKILRDCVGERPFSKRLFPWRCAAQTTNNGKDPGAGK